MTQPERAGADGPMLDERHVLEMLGRLKPGFGIEIIESHGLQDVLDGLIARGFVECVIGYYALTDAGRSQLQRNRP